VVLSWIVLILVVAAAAALVSSIWLDRQKPADSAQAQAQPIATIPAGYQQPAYNPAPQQPDPAFIAQPEQPQPAQVAQPEPVAPQVVEARPTSEQYIIQDGQFVLAAEPAPTVVPGSAGPGGSSGGSTWGTP
jgi:type IV secretory pathway VirB10-like protein